MDILYGLTITCDSDLPGGTAISRRIHGHETDEESEHGHENKDKVSTNSIEEAAKLATNRGDSVGTSRKCHDRRTSIEFATMYVPPYTPQINRKEGCLKK